MCATVAKTRCTPDELLHMPDSAGYELVNGELVEKPMGTLSSWIGGRIGWFLMTYCFRTKNLGWVMPADTGYRCFADADMVRKPDLSFVRFGRLPNEELPAGHCTLAPDLVVEVLSPHDLAYEIDRKVQEYLAANVRLVWVVNPATKLVTVFRPDGSITGLRETDELDGEDVVPGFRCPVSEIFPPQQPSQRG